MSTSPPILLHFYTLSPFSQKIAWILNYKKVPYKVVSISPIEPRPLRRPLDGGYRKTPILQIGNLVFCDTKRIIDEIESRFPEPSLYPLTRAGESTKSLSKGLGMWLDNHLFLSIGSQFDMRTLPPKLAKDRLGFMNKSEKDIKPPHILKPDLISQFTLVDQILGDKKWLFDTDRLSLADLKLAMDAFFISNIAGRDWLQENFPRIDAHFDRTLEAVDFDRTDTMEVISPKEALEVAKSFAIKPNVTPTCQIPELSLGQIVSVTPLDTGALPSVGTLISVSDREVIIEKKDQETGVHAFIHFPIMGFAVVPVNSKL